MKKKELRNYSGRLQKILKKLRLRTWISFGILVVLLPVIVFSLFHSQKADAAWFDDGWTFRKRIPITAHTGAETNKYFSVTVDTSDTTRFQADCGDIRFTDNTGSLLQYYIFSGCSSGTTVIHVLVPVFPIDATDYYMYYGNANAANGFSSADFTAGTGVTVGSVGSEEKGNGPIAYWNFGQGTDNTCSGGTNDACDGTANRNDGAISNGTVWKNEDLCLFGKCLFFDGTNDIVTVTNATAIDLDATAGLSAGFTFEGWIRPNGAGEGTGGQIFFKGTNTWLNVTNLSSGLLDLSASVDLATTDATVTASAKVTDNRWTHIALSYTDDADDEITLWVNGVSVGTSTNGVGSLAADTNNLVIGGTTTNNFKGFIDEVKIYNFEKTAAQIATSFGKAGTRDSISASLGSSSQSSFLSDGLTGYWKMDETSWATNCSTASVLDASGNGNNGAPCPNASAVTLGGGKFGTAGSFDGTNDYIGLPSTSIDPTQKFTISTWINPTSLAGSPMIIGSYSGTEFQFGVNPSGQLDFYGGSADALSSTGSVVTGSWQHIVVTYNGAGKYRFYVNGVDVTSTESGDTLAAITTLTIGRWQGNYFVGKIDEVKFYNKMLSAGDIRNLYNWAPGPAGYWTMDEGTGQNVYDTSGNGYTGTLGATTAVEAVDPAWVTGKFGSAVNFDGSTSNKYVLLGDNDGLDVTANEGLTISAWVRRTGNAQFNNRQSIYDKISTGTSAGYSLTIEATSACNDAASDGNLICFNMSDGTDTYLMYTTSATITADSTWHYVTATIDRNSETNSQIYIDGVAQDVTRSGTFANVGDLSSSTVSCIGITSAGVTCMTASPTNQMNGDIESVKIYKYPRTTQQIIEDLNGGHPAGGSPLGTQIIKWGFDEGQGTTAFNTVDANTDGTLTNMASPATSTSGWTASGKIDRALVFDGSDDKVVIATANDANVDFNGSEPFSLCSWIYPTTMAGSGQYDAVIGKYDETSTLRGYMFSLTNDDGDTTGNLDFTVYDESANQALETVTANDIIQTNTWYHVCATFNGSTTGTANSSAIYVNGVLRATNTVNASFLGLEDVAADFTVGDYDATDVAALSTAFTGRIDEVQVYASVLSAEQVGIVMNANAAVNYGSGQDEATQITGSAETPPIAYLSFDENTGTTANDISGNGKTGTLRNTTKYVTGKIGSGVYFNGVNGGSVATDTHVTFVDSTFNTSFTNAFTFETWLKPNDTGDDFQDFFGIATNGGLDSGTFIEMGYERSTDKVWFYSNWAGAGQCNGSDIRASVVLPGSQTAWHHVAFTMNSSGNAMYIDGIKQSLSYDSGTSATYCSNMQAWTTGSNVNISIGCWYQVSTGCYNAEMYEGSIDEFKIYDYARTQAQIAYDYNRGGPVGWWKLDECQGSTAYDASGNALNGTISIGGTGTQTAVGTCATSSTAWGNGAVGKYNNSLSFDGTDDKVTLTDNALYDLKSSGFYSVSGWIKPSSIGTGNVMFDSDSSTTTAFTVEAVTTADTDFGPVTNGVTAAWLSSWSTNGLIAHTKNNVLSTGVWAFVTATYDGSQSQANRIKIYVNGIDQTDTTDIRSVGTITDISPTATYIGSDTANEYFAGQIDDVRFYNYTLSASQVRKLYNNGSSVYFGPVQGTPAP